MHLGSLFLGFSLFEFSYSSNSDCGHIGDLNFLWGRFAPSLNGWFICDEWLADGDVVVEGAVCVRTVREVRFVAVAVVIGERMFRANSGLGVLVCLGNVLALGEVFVRQ
jgi:hypothetical protein